MEIYPVIVHKAANKWVEGKPQPADEVGEEYKPLVGLWSRDDMSRLWETVCDLLGQVSGLSELLDILLLNGGGHPLALRSGSRHGWSAFWAAEMGASVLELENE